MKCSLTKFNELIGVVPYTAIILIVDGFCYFIKIAFQVIHMKTKELKDAISYLPIDQRIEIAQSSD
ncbi:MAG: hypothetical protein EA359_10230 [Balneolaceae bacterium]|nr:MAG: hypothetical protein EA359_10230 [Balneolaceae bacterium]